MRIALIRGSLLRTWELPNYVLDGAEVTAFASRRSAGALGDAPIPVRTLPSLGDLRSSLGPRVGGALEVLAGSTEYLPGLERALDGLRHRARARAAEPAAPCRRCRRAIAGRA